MSGDTAVYKVVVNGEGQYSIWPDGSPDRNPPGWMDAGFKGTREACLAHIREIWTDMRPRSLRDRMERAGS